MRFQPCATAFMVFIERTPRQEYVLDNFVWTDEMQKMSENIKKVSKTLNGKVESPLADKLLSE